MNALVMNCSPVRNGATAWIVHTAAEKLGTHMQVREICIDDYRIKYCTGCRSCHATAGCVLEDDVPRLMRDFDWADILVLVSPSYWADVPGQFKVFIDRCTPWSNTHEPHAALGPGKKAYAIALRTGPGMKECERVIGSIEHFLGHLNVECCGHLGLCGVENRADAENRAGEILAFLDGIPETAGNAR